MNEAGGVTWIGIAKTAGARGGVRAGWGDGVVGETCAAGVGETAGGAEVLAQPWQPMAGSTTKVRKNARKR